MNIVRFEKAHLDRMIVQEQQAGLMYLETDETFAAIANDDAFSAIDDDGTVYGCSGIVRVTEHRGIAWAYLARGTREKMIPVTRAVKRYLDIAPFVRIEMQVDCEFEAGHRWARMLGFEMECERMRAFSPDLRDHALYAMVKL